MSLSNIGGSDTYTLEEQQLRYAISSSSFPQFFSLQIQANDITSSATFAGIFDLYRVEMCEVLFRPTGVTTVTAGATGAIATIPKLFTFVDYNDAVAPAALTAFQRSTRTRQCSATDCMKVAFQPRYASAVYLSAVATAYQVGPKSSWLSTSAMGVPHYGVKYALTEDSGTGGPLNGQFTYEVWTKVRIQFARRK